MGGVGLGLLGADWAAQVACEAEHLINHAHIVVIMRATDRPLTAADMDALVSAELPPEPAADDTSAAAVAQRRLRALVLEHMLHTSARLHRECQPSPPPTPPTLPARGRQWLRLLGADWE